MRIVRMIVGMLLLTAGLPILLAAGGLWTVGQHRDPGGGFRADLETLDVPGQALIIEDLDGLLRRDAAFARTGRTELRITATAGDAPAFVGLAPMAAATGYLRTARHTRFEHLALTNGPLPVRVSTVSSRDAAGPAGDPGREEFWTRSGDGSLAWTADEIRDRGLALVIMSADGRPAGPVTVTAELRPDWLTAATWGGFGGGLLLIIIGMAALAWPSRPRELVYVVEPGRFPDLAARLGPRASVIREGEDGLVITTTSGRPIRGGRTATLLAGHGAARGAGAAGDVASAAGHGAARGDGAAGDAATSADVTSGDGAAARPATLADATRVEAAEGGATSVKAAQGGTPPAAEATTRSKGRTRPRPPVTPQLNWPPLTRDLDQDTKPPIPTGGAGATVFVPEAMPTASAAAAEALGAHAEAARASEARPADADVPTVRTPDSGVPEPRVEPAGVPEPRIEPAEVPEARAAATDADVASAEGGGTAEPVSPRRKRAAAPSTRTPAKRTSAAGSDAPAVPTADLDVEVTGQVRSAPVKRQPRRAAAAVSAEKPADAGTDASAQTPAPRVGRRRKPEPAAE